MGRLEAMSQPHPPAPTESSEPTRRRPPVVKIVAVLMVLVLLGVAGAVAVVSLTGPTEHTLELTDTAGGMERESALDQQLRSGLQAAEERFVERLSVAAAGEERALEYTRVGVYDQADEQVGPTGGVAFLGAKASTEQDADQYIEELIATSSANEMTAGRVDAGEDAPGACVTHDAEGGITICAWATIDTVGQVVPTTPGWTREQLAPLRVDVRADVETTD